MGYTAAVGATGAVGGQMIKMLEESPLQSMGRYLASAFCRKSLTIAGKILTIETTECF